MSAPTQAKRFLQLETVLGKDALIISGASGREELGRLPEIRIEFTAARDNIDLDALLGTKATLALKLSAEKGKSSAANTRFFNGYFSRITCAGYQREGRANFRATLVPWLWFLTRTSDCRIFQNQSVKEIIETVFHETGFADYKFNLKKSYPTLDFCVQYRETDFNFVSRLMEREGIYYHFIHQNGGHKMVLCDDMTCHKPEKNFETLTFIGGSSVADKLGVITAWEYSREVKPGTFSHNDFNFLTPTPDPNLRLVSRSSAPKAQNPKPFEIYDAPGGFGDSQEGSRYARIRMEELLADRDVAKARTNIQGVCAGRTFTLAKHPNKKQNRDHLITSAQWSAHEGAYGSGDEGGEEFFSCDFTCIPDDAVFRPARLSIHPKIEGPQTATVCGPHGQEIHVDAQARVKVQFHWDRYGKNDASSSCWIRVSQPWAGKGFGGMSIPRIGQEVIVEFIEADPDRPIITGRVYNASNLPDASNAGRDGKPGNAKPKDMTQAAMMTSLKSNSLGGSGGHNEITMNDTGGAETLYFKAQKDEIRNVGNDREDTVGNNESRTVGVNRSREVGSNEAIKIGVNRNKTVLNNETETIGANQTSTVGANKSLTVAIAHSETVGAAKTTQVGGLCNLTVGGAYTIEVGGAMNAAVGGWSGEEVGINKTIIAGKDISLKAGQGVAIGGSDEIAMKSGAASIVLKKDGTIEISGVNVIINGSASVSLDAPIAIIN